MAKRLFVVYLAEDLPRAEDFRKLAESRGFTCAGNPLKGAALTEDWKQSSRALLAQCDAAVALCGAKSRGNEAFEWQLRAAMYEFSLPQVAVRVNPGLEDQLPAFVIYHLGWLFPAEHWGKALEHLKELAPPMRPVLARRS